MHGIKILKQDIDPKDFKAGDLTTDCMYVCMDDGTIDLVRAQAMVKVFDEYHDAGKRIVRIYLSGGNLNPKLSEPKV